MAMDLQRELRPSIALFRNNVEMLERSTFEHVADHAGRDEAGRRSDHPPIGHTLPADGEAEMGTIVWSPSTTFSIRADCGLDPAAPVTHNVVPHWTSR
jgi:hypothetical protein